MQSVAVVKNIRKIKEVLIITEQNFIFRQYFNVFRILIDANSVKTDTIQPLYNLIELDWQSKSKKLKDIKNKD